MIRRGGMLSRSLALLVIASPLLIGGGWFASWALTRWSVDGERIATAERALHLAQARAVHAGHYRPLGDAWIDYASTSLSGLAQEPDAAAALEASAAKLRRLFERFGGDARAAHLYQDEGAGGLGQIQLEALGELPEQSLPVFLAALENEPPALFIDLLDIRRVSTEAGVSRLSLRMRLSVYRLGEG